MTTLLRVACADISAHARDLLAFGILGLAVVVLAVGINGADSLAIVPTVFTFVVAFMPSRLFGQDERSNLPTMFSLLPASRSAFVVARYLLVATAGAIAIALGLAIHDLGTRLLLHSGGESSFPVFAILGIASLAVFSVCAVQMPFFFGFGVGRMGTVTVIIPMILIFGASGFINNFPDQAARITGALDSAWTLPVCLITSAGLLIVSACASIPLFARRDL
ncbi:ABC-2 transporter permease [Actinomyces mediterranea]|uniref:ABC-2 transporter permease n=1 Tax=Actinomyces mediterranea TaxID=1871028 RepID=UPI000970DDC9|nr:ABC-2 transporter permease [Actinomyces mediterranea]